MTIYIGIGKIPIRVHSVSFMAFETVNGSMASLSIASDRKSSTLVLPQVTLRDAAVYYCVLREAHWGRRGCTCAASLVGRRGDTAGRAVTRANLESSRRRVREQ